MDLVLNIRKTRDTAELALVYEETDEPAGVTLTLAGPDSETYLLADDKVTNLKYDLIRKGRKADGQLGRELARELLAACTLGWKFYPPALTEDQQGPELTLDHVREFYAIYPDLAGQAMAFMSDRANFRETVCREAD